MRPARFVIGVLLFHSAFAVGLPAADVLPGRLGATAALADAAAAAPERGGAVKPRDIVLALDNCGSSRQNDPQPLMPQVVSAFAGRLGPGSRLGIVLFGDRAEVVLALAGPEAPDFQDRVAASLKRIDYRGQRTDIPAGVERALYELRERGRPEAERLIVLLTDGMVDLGSAAKDVERARWLRESLAQEAKRVGVRIFGVAFTEAADFELMQSVAQTSGGDYFRVLAAADIPGAFERISARIQQIARQTPAPQVPAVHQPPLAPPPTDWRPWAMAAGVAAILVALGVVTMARRGRRGASDIVVPPATLHDRSGCTGVEAHPIRRAVTRIGREPAINDIAIARDTVSGKHAEVVYREGTFYARDLLSANGTFLNGKKFSDPEEIREVPLKSGDRVRFDAYEFEFIVSGLPDPRVARDAGRRGVWGSTR